MTWIRSTGEKRPVVKSEKERASQLPLALSHGKSLCLSVCLSLSDSFSLTYACARVRARTRTHTHTHTHTLAGSVTPEPVWSQYGWESGKARKVQRVPESPKNCGVAKS